MADLDPSLWLTPAEEREWQALLKSTPAFTLTAMLCFWSLHAIIPRLMRDWVKDMPSSTKLRWQHQVSCSVHAMLSVAAGAGTLLKWAASGGGGAASDPIFSIDPLSSHIMDAHAGFLLYDLVAHTRYVGVLVPPFPFLFLQHGALLACWLAAKIFPCTLTGLLLPLHQVGAIAALAHAWRTVAVMRGTGKVQHLKRLRVEIAAMAVKLTLAAVAAYRAWIWLHERPLLTLLADTPDLATMARVYATLVLACGALMVLIYVVWLQTVLHEMANVPIIRTAATNGVAPQHRAALGRAKPSPQQRRQTGSTKKRH